MATSHAAKDDLSVEKMGDYEGRMAELPDGYTANFEAIPAGMGGPELFKGLPDDACQAPHWGQLFKGKFKATYTDGSEDVVAAGEAYYLRPGHVYEALEDVESIEFSPTAEWRQTMEQVGKNAESMQQADQPLEAAGIREQALSRENVEVVREALDAVNRRDTAAGLPSIDPEAELQSAIIGGAEGNTYRGHEGIRDWMAESDGLLTLRDGKIVRARGYLNPEEALEAGLSE